MADSDHTGLVHGMRATFFEVYQVPGSSAGWILTYLCNSAFTVRRLAGPVLNQHE